jgi:hypothetical protein
MKLLKQRWFLIPDVATLMVLAFATHCSLFAAQNTNTKILTLTDGDLQVIIRDNAESPATLSGIASLINLNDAPVFCAFDLDNSGAGAGLNFEHIISGHNNSNNSFTPRKGAFDLFQVLDGKSAQLVRKKEDDPWAMSSTLKYTVANSNAIDVEFSCIPHDEALFGKRGYAILFFANYMNDVEDVAINFRGIEGANKDEKWISADAPNGHADWNQGGTYKSIFAPELEYDPNHNFKLNSWSYDYPRFTKPFYYGIAANGMAFMLMFNKTYSEEDEIRFSIFKFKLPQALRPAWDFQYVIHKVEEEKEFGFKARLVWKKFVSQEDCINEYETWVESIKKD